MTKELNFITVAAIADEVFKALLDQFETEFGVHVNMTVIGWETYRADFVNVALKRKPVDVSLVGTPITSDLLGMNMLRPFSTAEINELGGQAAFLPPRFQSGIRPGDERVWAIPWMADIRAFYYWKDMFAAAGVDEATAFLDHTHMQNTLAQLKAAGIATPWSVPEERYALLHTVSSWIWSSGGDLFAPDGKQVVFQQPASLKGQADYFSLRQYTPQQGGHSLSGDRFFLDRKVAITLGNGWGVAQNLNTQLGCTAPLGSSYLGGPDLIVWGHTRHEPEALDFVRFMSRPEIQRQVSLHSGLLPVLVSELEALGNDGKPTHRTLVDSAYSGRTFPCVPMIGLVEDRLSMTLLQIQRELIARPDLDIQTLLYSRVYPLANRTNLSLS